MSRSRSEFSKATRAQRYVFVKGRCEACGCDLAGKKAEYHHDIADGAGGKPTFSNCVLLCAPCHRVRTSTHDIPLVAKIKRQSAVAAGVKTESSRKIQSPGFPPQSSRRTKHPIDMPARRVMFMEGE